MDDVKYLIVQNIWYVSGITSIANVLVIKRLLFSFALFIKKYSNKPNLYPQVNAW